MNVAQVARAAVNGTELEYTVVGTGEALVFIDGALPDAFGRLWTHPELEQYRRIAYRRRGYGGSASPDGSAGIVTQAADCLALLRHLGVEHAHVAGHSLGGSVALQLALDAPQAVASLALFEAALPSVLFASPVFGAAVGRTFELYGAGRRAEAFDAFLAAACGPSYVDDLGGTPPDPAPLDTMMANDFAALQGWRFGPDEAARIQPPTLCVLGERSAEAAPVFEEAHDLLLTSLPRAEGVVLPGATHLLGLARPREAAELLADFLRRNALREG